MFVFQIVLMLVIYHLIKDLQNIILAYTSVKQWRNIKVNVHRLTKTCLMFLNMSFTDYTLTFDNPIKFQE